MKKVNDILLVSLFLLGVNKAESQYSVYVHNASTFTIRSTAQAIKGAYYKDPNNGGGVTSSLKPGQVFLFNITPVKGGLPKGVEGSIRFTIDDPKITGFLEVHFDNPYIGNPGFEIVSADSPFGYQILDKSKLTGWALPTDASTAIEISVDTAHHDTKNPTPWNTSGSSNLAQNMEEPIPPIINFDWQVTQRMKKDDDDDNDGKAYKEVTYYFTTNGDYAAARPDDKSFSLMVYSKKGHTWLFDDKKKTITVMNMAKTVGEGGLMAKAVAESIHKAPLKKDKDDDEEFTITKTGKTKNILGYTADEYEMKNNKVLTTKTTAKTGTASFWYVRAPFDPVKIYTMGAGRPADVTKLQNDPRMKNNIAAIPVLNKNYLQAEMEAGNIKGMETTEIKHVNNTIYTANYKIKVVNSLKDMMTRDDDDK